MRLLHKVFLISSLTAFTFVSVSAQDAKITHVGITVGTLGNPFFVPLIAGATDAVNEVAPDAEVTVVGADYDLNKQTTQIENFIASGVQLLIINAVDGKAVAPVIARAKAAGIFIGAVDVTADGADITVMTNNVQAGDIACTYLAEQIHGKGKVVIINGPPVSSVMDRVKGCQQAFSRHPDIEILSDNQDGKGSRDGSFAVMQGLLTRYSHIDAVFGANDPSALGADLAARQINRHEMIIAGVDGAPDVIKAIKSGATRIVASASQDPYGMAVNATRLTIDLAKGKVPLQKVLLLDTKLVHAGNVDTFVGWDSKR